MNRRRRYLAAGFLAGSLLPGLTPAQRSGVAVLPDGTAFELEIALDQVSRARGYMGREEVGPREGMLFVFPASGWHPFWMRNTLVSLDIIWLDEQWRVVQIAHEQQPCPPRGPCPSIVPLRAARYVLEVAGGIARRHGLRVGQRVEVDAEFRLP